MKTVGCCCPIVLLGLVGAMVCVVAGAVLVFVPTSARAGNADK